MDKARAFNNKQATRRKRSIDRTPQIVAEFQRYPWTDRSLSLVTRVPRIIIPCVFPLTGAVLVARSTRFPITSENIGSRISTERNCPRVYTEEQIIYVVTKAIHSRKRDSTAATRRKHESRKFLIWHEMAVPWSVRVLPRVHRSTFRDVRVDQGPGSRAGLDVRLSIDISVASTYQETRSRNKRGRNLDTNRWKVQRKEGKGRCARALEDGNRADLSAPGNFRKADVLLSISSSAESFLYNYARACTVFRCSPEADAIFHFTKWITRLGDEAFPVDTQARTRRAS